MLATSGGEVRGHGCGPVSQPGGTVPSCRLPGSYCCTGTHVRVREGCYALCGNTQERAKHVYVCAGSSLSSAMLFF